MTTEPEVLQIAESQATTAMLSEARWKSGDLYVYRHVLRCPSCDGYWTFEVAAPRGAIEPKVAPGKIGPGLLCGTCRARRTAYAVFPRDDGSKSGLMRFWCKDDEEQIWKRCCGESRRDYAPQITRLGLWDRTTELVDEREARMREILDVGGRRIPGITPGRAQRLGLDWVTHEIERGER